MKRMKCMKYGKDLKKSLDLGKIVNNLLINLT